MIIQIQPKLKILSVSLFLFFTLSSFFPLSFFFFSPSHLFLFLLLLFLFSSLFSFSTSFTLLHTQLSPLTRLLSSLDQHGDTSCPRRLMYVLYLAPKSKWAPLSINHSTRFHSLPWSNFLSFILLSSSELQARVRVRVTLYL